ncbi:RNA polymerase sigma factor [Aquimarina algiphila]|uniref:RNA polymerase sigma factor n=1 Tax=Aquimarina algiphila TaxID=2047982 RepID=UPI00249088B5|nr:hypothetical protein [Aquimarina algiphila]
MDSIDVKYIIECAQKGNEAPFNTFFNLTYKKIKPKLLSLTNSLDDSQEIFIISMQKFWERFVINQENLPHNSTGYIVTMCKNAWLMQKRSKKNVLISVENSLANQVFKSQDIEVDSIEESQTTENIKLLRHKALIEALNMLSDKCRLLIENELNNDRKLKDLQEELGFKNYQALVQAKYNCKKRLVRKVYEVIEKLEEKQKTKM